MAGPTLFLSYRRDDASANAGRLYDWLARQFGRANVFLDTDAIAAGAEFPQVIEERLAAVDVLLAVIGPQWAAIADAHGRRLDQPEDFVRCEIAAALARGTRIVPVLVRGARMPSAAELPEVLRPLADRNAVRLEDASFERDFDFLVDEILERPRNFLRRELDRLQRLVFVATRSAFVAPLVVAMLLLAVWVRALDAFGLDTQVASYLMWAADVLSPRATTSPVVLVAIDAATEQRLGRPFGPATAAAWRHDHARIIDRAAAAGASAVVFDLFLEANQPAADAALAAAAQRARESPAHTRTIFGVRTVANGTPVLADALRDVAAWGSLCLVRRLAYTVSAPLALLRSGDGRISEVMPADTPALALAAAAPEPLQAVDVSRREIRVAGPPAAAPIRYSALERIRWGQGTCRTLALGDDVAMLLLRLSPPGFWHDPARRIDYADLLAPQGVPDERLRGRILLVGVTDVAANRDVHDLVRGLSRSSVYGVELQADAIANLSTGEVMTTPTADLQAVVMTVMALAGAAASFCTAVLGRAGRRLVLAGAVAGYLLIAVGAALGGLLLNVLYDLAAFGVAHRLLRWLQRRSLRDIPAKEMT